jgi:hypothetical protein
MVGYALRNGELDEDAEVTDLDLPHLRHAHPVKVVSAESGHAYDLVTSKGHEFVSVFNLAKVKERFSEPAPRLNVEALAKQYIPSTATTFSREYPWLTSLRRSSI